jgi:hypothetical protein
MRHQFGLSITVMTGPATDNEVGQVYIQTGLGLPAHNARRDAAGLLSVVRASLEDWGRSQETGVRDQVSSGAVSQTPDSRLLAVDSR